MNSIFEKLVEFLQSTQPDEVPEPEQLIAEELPPEQAPESQGATEFDIFLGELAGIFNASVEGFIESLDSVSVLPPLSEPNGNGAAYEKFVEIYNDMIGAPSTQGGPEGEIIDAVG